MTLTKRRAGKARRAAPPTVSTAGRAFGYARVSTARQSEEGLSLEVQQRTIEGYAQMHGLKLTRIYVERGVSGSKPLPERDQGSALIQELHAGDIVITSRLDRMFRSAVDALDVMEAMKNAGIALHMIDLGGDVTSNGGNTVSKLVFTILAAVAEAERDRIRERITEVKADQRRQGKHLGGIAPYGYRRVAGTRSDLEPIPEKQRFIRQMVTLREQGLTLRAIQAELREAGEPISLVSIDRTIKAAMARRAA